MARLIAYGVYVTYLDEMLSSDIDNVFPTAESAVRHAKKIIAGPALYEVYVNKIEITEEYGWSYLASVYREKRPDRL